MAEIREEIDKLIEVNEFAKACSLLHQFGHQDKSLSATNFISQKLELILPHSDLASIKVAILSSFVAEPLIPFLKVKCFQAGLNLQVYVTPFNQFQQEILDSASGIYKFHPEVTFIFLRLEEVRPILIDSFLELTSSQIEKLIIDLLQDIRESISVFRSRSKTFIVMYNFDRPRYPAFGIIDQKQNLGHDAAISKINNGLSQIAKEFKEVFIFDYERCVSDFGRQSWYDNKMYYYAKVPFSSAAFRCIADNYIRFIKPIKGLNKKCLVLDLDGVLWGKILGEEGAEGIQLSDDYPGIAYKNFQKEILKLYHKGVILAINSKNNEEDVLEVFEKNPNMLFKKENFASLRINWNDKATNMKEIAQDLNIGTDSMVFIDDSPVERELIRQKLPEVKILELPADASDYASFISGIDDFESLILSEEDKRRGEFYRAKSLTDKLRADMSSLKDFFRSLNMIAWIKRADFSVASRLAQLTQKTNQFNLTTIRYTESDILKLINSDDAHIYYLLLKDRFVDNGIVSEIIIRDNKNKEWMIDTFLLSCRVMNRTVEKAFLSYIIKEARKEGMEYLSGKYIPTKKNQIVKDIYKEFGFKNTKNYTNGESCWVFNLKIQDIDCPPWITIKERL